tara:strand:+ start:942 stop:1133 length:192 start_codon:yes stop_codon:yes gene_type:complete
MAKIIHKKPLPKRPRNLLHAEMVKQGILKSKVIGDKRHKVKENQAKHRAYQAKLMTKEMLHDE